MTDEEIISGVRLRFTRFLLPRILFFAALAIFAPWFVATKHGLDYANALLGTNRFWLLASPLIIFSAGYAVIWDLVSAAIRPVDSNSRASRFTKLFQAIA